MPKNEVNDLITDQEMAFARLVLYGTMTDRDAAQTAGLNPDTAAYTKAKPRVRAYMLEHRAAVQQKLVEQEAEGLRQQNTVREKVLLRLWEVANMGPEMTRNSITGQVKAIAMIVAIEGLIPDRRAVSAQKEAAPLPNKATIFQAQWLRKQRGETIDPQPGTPLSEKDGPGLAGSEQAPAPASGPADSDSANRRSPSETNPYSPPAASAPDTRVPFSIQKNPFAPYR